MENPFFFFLYLKIFLKKLAGAVLHSPFARPTQPGAKRHGLGQVWPSKHPGLRTHARGPVALGLAPDCARPHVPVCAALGPPCREGPTLNRFLLLSWSCCRVSFLLTLHFRGRVRHTLFLERM